MEQELLRDIKSLNRLLSRRTENHNAYHLLAGKYDKLFDFTHEREYSEQALLNHNRAVDLAPNNPLYRIDRAKFLARIDMPFAEDFVYVDECIRNGTCDVVEPVIMMYVQNTLRDLRR